jgi:uncharacterized protein YbjT (DUF2867 family)
VKQAILVTGGSGTLGRSVVDRLLAADHQVRVLSRRSRPAGTPTAIDWVTGELISGRGLAAERLIQASGLPWTILRATQFHQLVLLVARGLARLPLVPVPAATSFQPIDAADVADRLTALAIGPPAGRVPDIGGPQIRTAADLLRTYLRMAGRRRPVLPVHLHGPVFAGYRQGGHLAPGHAVGHRTWEQFLSDHVGPRGRAPASRTTAGGRT